MKDTKLVTLLRTFSKQEMKDFEKFISSPYFSPQRNLMPLYRELKKYYPSFSSPDFTKEKIFKKLNPGKKFDSKKSNHYLQVLVSEMTTLAEKFLGFELIRQENEGFEMYNSISKAMHKRNLFDYSYRLVLKNIERIQKTESIRSYFNEMIEMYGMLEAIYLGSDKQHKVFDYVQRIPLYMYGCFLYDLGHMVNDYKALETGLNINIKIMELFEKSIDAFDPEIFEKECYDDGMGTKHLILTNYYLLKSLLNNYEEECLIKAIEIYKNEIRYFNNTVKWSFFTMIFNILVYRKGLIDFKKYSSLGSDVIDFAIDEEIFSTITETSNSSLLCYSIFHFKLAVLDSKELKKFIDLMLDKIFRVHENWLYKYLYAWLSFRNNDYEGTLEYLSKFNPPHPAVKDTATRLRIASLYSLGHIEEAVYNLNSYKHFVRNNVKVSPKINKGVLLFINSVQTLIKFRTEAIPVDENTLNKIIDDSKSSDFRLWFKEEAEKLKKAGL